MAQAEGGDQKTPVNGGLSARPPAPPHRWRRETLFALPAIAAVGIVFAIPSLPEPFGVDQGIYGYIAERLLEGAVDHRDVFDHKPPGVHFAYALAFAVFGHAMSSVWVLDLVVVILTAWGLFALGRQWVGPRTGLLAGLLYAACYQGFLDNMSRAQPETWLNLALVAALALMAGTRGRLGWPAAGAALGAGFWFKPTILLPALLCLVVLAERAREMPNGRGRRFGLDLAALAAGAVVVTGLVLLYYVRHGALDDLYEALWVFNQRYHVQQGFGQKLKQVVQPFRYLFLIKPLWAPSLLAGVAVVLAVGGRRRPVLLGLGWFVLAWATVFWQGSGQRAHYTLVLAPLALLAAVGIDGALAGVSDSVHDAANRRAALLAVGGAVACLFLWNLRGLFEHRVTKFTALATGRLTRSDYYATFSLKGDPRRGGYSFEDVRRLAAYVEERTAPGAPVFVWGFRPLIAFLADRRMPTRFCFRYPLTRANNPRWWAEFLADLQRSPPAYFVVVTRDAGLYHPEPSDQALEKNRALSLFLHDRYALDRTMSHFRIYRRRANGSAREP